MIPLIRIAKFLRRWSAPHGSTGPLIVYASEELIYIALRLRLSRHKVAWFRFRKYATRRLPSLEFSGPLDLRGHKCDCGSGIWIQNDVDGCMALGCRKYFLDGERG